MMPRPPRSNLTDPLFPYTPLFRSRRPAIGGATPPRPHRLSTPMEMLCTQRRAIVLFNESDSQLSLSVDAPPSRGIEASDWSAWRPDCRHLREPKAHDLCRHRCLRPVQIYGLRRGVPRRLLDRKSTRLNSS